MSNETIHCCTCGASICIPFAQLSQLKRDKTSFFCPMGHSNYFPGPTKEEKRIKELEGLLEREARRISQLHEALSDARKEARQFKCLHGHCSYSSSSKKRTREHMMKCAKGKKYLPANAGPSVHNRVVH